jgi:hypothetical protein
VGSKPTSVIFAQLKFRSFLACGARASKYACNGIGQITIERACTRDAQNHKTTARGFEPLLAEPNGFLVHHLNHSVTLSLLVLKPLFHAPAGVRWWLFNVLGPKLACSTAAV